MVRPDERSRRIIFGSFDLERFAPGSTREGPHGIPLLRPQSGFPPPKELIRFDRCTRSRSPQDTAIHFYVRDEKLRVIALNPLRHVAKFGSFGSVITPDFSLYRDSYVHERILHTSLNRLIGAIFQHHGLRVIPNIRWSCPDDFEFCFTGVPKGSMVAISTHGCSQSSEDVSMHREGIRAMIEKLDPWRVIVHGSRSSRIFNDLDGLTVFDFHEPDVRRLRPPREQRIDDSRLPFA